MAIKRKITKAEFDALSDALKEHYKENNGSYVLDADDATELITARDKEAREAADAKRERDELKSRLDQIEAAANRDKEERERERQRKDKDFDALETSWRTKLEEAKARADAEMEKLRDKLKKLLVDNKAVEIAGRISKSPKVILPHIRERLEAEIEGDNARTLVRDTAGNRSSLTLEELEAEFVANADFADIILASRASGGSAKGGGASGSAGKKFSELSEAERVALHKENPERYRQLRDAG